VRKIAFGVSACAELFEKAAEQKCDMVVVHHGLIWNEPNRITGIFRKRIKILLDNDISLAAYHLPLDMNAKIGHNAVLLDYIGAEKRRPFGRYHGQSIGFSGRLKQAATVGQLASVLQDRLHCEPNILAFGPEKIKTVSVVSGGGAKMLEDAIEQKHDLYITGELSEPVWQQCREAKINLIGLGHYNSEKAGIFELEKATAKKFRVKTEFIDAPNPL